MTRRSLLLAALFCVMSVAALAQNISAADALQSFTCKTAQGETLNLLPSVSALKYGGSADYATQLYGNPSDFAITCKSGYSGSVTYSNGIATVIVGKGSAGKYTALQNGDLQDGSAGWEFTSAGDAWSAVLESDPKVVEAYAGWYDLSMTDFSMKQSVNLPAGTYKLSAYAFYRYGVTYDVDLQKSCAKLYAGTAAVDLVTLGSISQSSYANSTADASAAFKAGNYKNELTFQVSKDGESVELGVKGAHDLKQSWCIAGPLSLQPTNADYLVFRIKFKVGAAPKEPAVPLKRGLMSVSLSGAGMGSGNLVSWRHRSSDDQGVKYKLFRGTSATSQPTKLNSGKYIIDRTNFNDTNGSATSYYRLETYDKYGNLLETEVSSKTWANQTMQIPISAPVDKTYGALYNPNDASFCDMDGDGEYEIILKWSPNNEKDVASNGNTSNPIFDCYKLNGTRLWRIDLGPNFFTSQHTIQFIAWDFDGDGYGEFMCKTGPGTIDGQGKYVVLGSDDPKKNWLNSRGKQVEGPEYITVFDGQSGAELATIPYHTNYAAGASYWGDDKQNRSERYLAALAYLDGPDKNPSPIFARGYYSGAFVAAYDWDGTTLKERWVSRNTQSGKGLWGEGAHWFSVADVDGDGKQELIYGSACLDHDGSLLYRTGLGHGDALHVGDFLTERDGLEVFMVHEKSPYGFDLRDAKTGEMLWRQTASGDTGRGLAAHFDSKEPSAQCIYSASASLFNLDDHSVNGETWAIGSSGAGINSRIYWDGDLYDEFFDKSIIAHWNPSNKWFDRYKVNNGYYVNGTLNNGTKYNPCVLGDILGDWREEIITHNGSSETAATQLIINATSYTSNFRLPHLMDDPQYRVQVVNQNCAYNQPPHLSFDPAVKYKGNPNVAKQEDEADPSGIETARQEAPARTVISTLQGVRIDRPAAPGIYIINGKKVVVK